MSGWHIPPGPGTALVTGGGSGIGLAIARMLAAAGQPVAIVDRDEQAGLQAADHIGAGVAFYRCDVTVEQEIADVTRAIAAELGPVGVLVNNAGVGLLASPMTLSAQDWDHLFDVDLKSLWLCAKHVNDQQRSLGGGAIVNIASIHAHLTRRGTFPYAAAKAGVLGLTRSLALELASAYIRVNAVCPGYVRTPPMIEQYDNQADPDRAWELVAATQPMGRIAEPQEIATVAAFLASDLASFVTGAAWNVDGGLSAQFTH